MSTYLVTGCAGFIGAKTAEMLLQKGHTVIGVDNLNDYYDVRLKEHRLGLLRAPGSFTFHKMDIEDEAAVGRLFKKYAFDAVINLAARAGARYSIENPYIYSTTNIHAALNLLEACRNFKVKKFVLASSSSLYAGQKMPFKETLPVNEPISPYAASKKAAEVMAYTYHYLYGTDISILRYFTVYGPAGRPDMSPFRFTRWIVEGEAIQLFGDGEQSRDFTYVDDIASGTIKALKRVGFEVINLGGGKKPVTINSMIALMEKYTGKQARVKHLPAHKADVDSTWADISKAKKLLNWEPKVEFEEGIRRTVEWYLANRAWAGSIQSK
ncbi:MAG TPA: GDP-mannose 4,6-dehydratase [Candidatus Omnitrophota bacterium]|nr:GDP-mannose 4,6-dehydratase [Candidatus Omnitrophota bacterium]